MGAGPTATPRSTKLPSDDSGSLPLPSAGSATGCCQQFWPADTSPDAAGCCWLQRGCRRYWEGRCRSPAWTALRWSRHLLRPACVLPCRAPAACVLSRECCSPPPHPLVLPAVQQCAHQHCRCASTAHRGGLGLSAADCVPPTAGLVGARPLRLGMLPGAALLLLGNAASIQVCCFELRQQGPEARAPVRVRAQRQAEQRRLAAGVAAAAGDSITAGSARRPAHLSAPYSRATSSGAAAALSAARPRCRPHQRAGTPTLGPRRSSAGQPYPPPPSKLAAHSHAGSAESRLAWGFKRHLRDAALRGGDRSGMSGCKQAIEGAGCCGRKELEM